MDIIFDNFQFLLIIGIAFAAWLKNRGNDAEEQEAERQAREEMIRHLKEVQERPAKKTPPPIPDQWDTSPQEPEPSAVKPPPLKELFNEMVQQLEPVPGMFQTPKPDNAYDDDPEPWDFEHVDASHSEITDTPDPHEQVLDRQRNMQERLAELKAQAAEYKGQAAGARETQRRAAGKSRRKIADLPPIATVLKDRSQTRRAVILNEILSKPIGLRGMS